VVSGISRANQRILGAGGTHIIDGDRALSYGWERVLETYYDFRIRKQIHGALDYQFITNPAFNRDRGPVSVFGARVPWEL
jgi:high affinity Mn2+ porin